MSHRHLPTVCLQAYHFLNAHSAGIRQASSLREFIKELEVRSDVWLLAGSSHARWLMLHALLFTLIASEPISLAWTEASSLTSFLTLFPCTSPSTCHGQRSWG